MTEREKSYAQLLYQPGDPELAADRDVTVRKLQEYNNMDPLDRSGRQAAIREILGKAGENCVVEQPLFCTYGYNTTVGDNFFMNVYSKLMDSGKHGYERHSSQQPGCGKSVPGDPDAGTGIT